MIHEANLVRPNTDGIKVGGHQASSASVVSILTALYFRWLRAGDLVAIKPHASPAYHALQYLLGNLDASMLTRLREFGGLQSYPSRTKDPDPVDFSTGSVGLGAVAPLFAALADRYLRLHFRESIASQPERRFVALVGDAELDEGNVWEAILEEGLGELGNVTMIVDLNRQSLDRVVPGIRIRRVEGMFAAAGWHVIEAKYGRRLQERFALPGGDALRERIDDMENEEYQILIRRPGPELRERLLEGAPAARRDDLARNVRDVPDDDLPRLIGDLGGHDQVELERAFRAADAETSPPDRHLRLHDQGLAPAVRGRQPQPLGASRARPGRPARARPRHRPRRLVGRLRGRLARRPARPAAAGTELGYDTPRRPDLAGDGARRSRSRTSGSAPRRARSRRSATRSRRSPATRRSAAGSSPPRPTSPSRPTSAAGSTGPASSRRTRSPDRHDASGRWSGSRGRPGATSSSASAR